MAVTHTYRYLQESSFSTDSGVGLATAGGRDANPFFFRGFVDNAAQVAKGLLAVSEVARTRYFDAGAAQRMRDPVVTSNKTVLRFESFSACNGVYARLDVDQSSFDAEHLDWGTTNIDVNEPLRAALSSVMTGDPLRVSVGSEELAVETLDAAVIERKVPLPTRWLRGFAEVQIDSSLMAPLFEFDAAMTRLTLRDMATQKTGNRPMWLKQSGRSIRLTPTPDASAPSIVGPQRLGALLRLLPHARSLKVFKPDQGERAKPETLASSAWVLQLDGARLTLIVSPELYRGFSGEGGVLLDLANADESTVAAASDKLAGQAAIQAEPSVAKAASVSNTVGSLTTLRALGSLGRVGHEIDEGFFHRDLPFDRSALEDLHPRLLDARELLAANAVTTQDNGQTALIKSGDTTYTVRTVGDETRCTCRWYAKHRDERGPCKHILAVELTSADRTDSRSGSQASDHKAVR